MKIKNSSMPTLDSISKSPSAINDQNHAYTLESKEFISSDASKAAMSYSCPQISKSKHLTFEGNVGKIIHSIVTAPNPKKLHLSLKEILNVVNHLGCEIRQNGTSHCVIEVHGQRPIVVASHGHGDVNPGVIDSIRDLIYYHHPNLLT